MKTALVVIATGRQYWIFARKMMESAKKFFPEHDVFIWTDYEPEFGGDVTRQFKTEFIGYPAATLYRYHMFLQAKNELLKYDQMFYVDADMLFVNPVGDIFSDGITATLHPGYLFAKKGTENHFPVERRPRSKAFCPDLVKYYCGGFNGGGTKAFLEMAEVIKVQVDEDISRGITAIWNDESYYNKYLHENPPAKVLNPSYCFPEGIGPNGYCGWTPDEFPAILVALNKTREPDVRHDRSVQIPLHRRRKVV